MSKVSYWETRILKATNVNIMSIKGVDSKCHSLANLSDLFLILIKIL